MLQDIMASTSSRTLLFMGGAMIVAIGYYYLSAPSPGTKSSKKLRKEKDQSRSILIEEKDVNKNNENEKVAVDVIIQERSIDINFEKKDQKIVDVRQQTREILIEEQEPEKVTVTPDTTASDDLDVSLEEAFPEEDNADVVYAATPTDEEPEKTKKDSTISLKEGDDAADKNGEIHDDNGTTTTSISSITTTLAEEEAAQKDGADDIENWDIITSQKNNGEETQEAKATSTTDNDGIGPVMAAAIAAAAAAEAEKENTTATTSKEDTAATATEGNDGNESPTILYEDKFLIITPAELTLKRYHKPNGTSEVIARDTIERVYLGTELGLNYFRKSWWGTITFSKHTIFWAKCEARESNDDKNNFVLSKRGQKVKDGFTVENPELVSSLLDEYIVKKSR